MLGAAARAAADVWVYAFLPVYLHLHLHESRLWLVTAALTAPAAVRWAAAPIWGRTADRSRRPRRLLAVGLLGYAAMLLGISVVNDVATLIVLVSAATAIASAFNPVSRALVSTRDPSRSLLDLASWHQWEAGGYLLSGLVIGRALEDARLFATLASAMAFVLAAGAFWLWLQREPPDDGLRGSSPGPAREAGSRRSALDARTEAGATAHTFVGALLFLFVGSLVWEAVAGTFGLYFTQIAKGSPTTFGFVISASTGLSFILYKPLARWGQRASTRRLFAVGALSATLMYALMAVPSPWTVALSYMVPFTSIVRTAFNSLLVSDVSPRRRGEFLGTVESAESGAAVLGPVAGGMSADRFGLAAVPLFALSASLVLHLLVTSSSRRRIS